MSNEMQNLIDDILLNKINDPYAKSLHRQRALNRVKQMRIERLKRALSIFKSIKRRRFKQSTIFDF